MDNTTQYSGKSNQGPPIDSDESWNLPKDPEARRRLLFELDDESDELVSCERSWTSNDTPRHPEKGSCRDPPPASQFTNGAACYPSGDKSNSEGSAVEKQTGELVLYGKELVEASKQSEWFGLQGTLDTYVQSIDLLTRELYDDFVNGIESELEMTNFKLAENYKHSIRGKVKDANPEMSKQEVEALVQSTIEKKEKQARTEHWDRRCADAYSTARNEAKKFHTTSIEFNMANSLYHRIRAEYGLPPLDMVIARSLLAYGERPPREYIQHGLYAQRAEAINYQKWLEDRISRRYEREEVPPSMRADEQRDRERLRKQVELVETLCARDTFASITGEFNEWWENEDHRKELYRQSLSAQKGKHSQRGHVSKHTESSFTQNQRFRPTTSGPSGRHGRSIGARSSGTVKSRLGPSPLSEAPLVYDEEDGVFNSGEHLAAYHSDGTDDSERAGSEQERGSFPPPAKDTIFSGQGDTASSPPTEHRTRVKHDSHHRDQPRSSHESHGNRSSSRHSEESTLHSRYDAARATTSSMTLPMRPHDNVTSRKSYPPITRGDRREERHRSEKRSSSKHRSSRRDSSRERDRRVPEDSSYYGVVPEAKDSRRTDDGKRHRRRDY